jgi:thymidylate synthase
MAHIDKTYRKVLIETLKNGYEYDDPNRKKVKRIEIPSFEFRHQFRNGFPAITTKNLFYHNVASELIWFLKGDTNIKYLVDCKNNIWNKDAYKYFQKNTDLDWDIKLFVYTIRNTLRKHLPTYGDYTLGDLGPVYGRQWRNFNGEDQIARLIKNLKEKPMATDHIVNSWNAGQLNDMALPPCHFSFQIIVRPLSLLDKYNIYNSNEVLKRLHPGLSINRGDILDEIIKLQYGFELHWLQRSVDTFLGLPYNIASYATLAILIERITGYKDLAIQGDLKKVHVYDNSLDAVNEQVSRDTDKYKECRLDLHPQCEIAINAFNSNILTLDEFVNELTPEMFLLVNYGYFPHISVPMLERD